KDVETIQSIAQHIAIAVKNARLFQQIVTERQRISTLYTLGQAIATSLHPETILQTALDLTCEALKSEFGIAWLYIDGNITPKAIAGQDKSTLAKIKKLQDQEILTAEGLIGRIINDKIPVNFASIQTIEDPPSWHTILNIQSVLAAPIMESDDPQGMIAVFHTKTSAFDNNHLDLLQAICQQVSLALSNARRYQDINHLADLLEAERVRLEKLLEMLPVGVLLLDEKHQLLIANPLGRLFLHHLAPEISSTEPLTHLGNYKIADLLEQHTDMHPVEIVIDHPKHTIFELQAQAVAAENPQLVITLRDITQEREVQNRIQMQERLATVGQLAAGIAHDFNNIMAAIVVYADLLLMDKTLQPTSQERLMIIQQQVQRATSLIRQILDFSRRSVMEQDTLNLLPFLKETEKLLKRTLPETISISLHYKNDEYIVLADPTRLQQVFMNLAVNARDAMPDGGEIRFDLSKINIKPEDTRPTSDIPSGAWIWVRITDTGTGIPPEAQPHIFEPFFTTKPVGKGTGLGLAQVYGIIKQHNGFINFESRPESGTQFNIYLPSYADTIEHKTIETVRLEMNGHGKIVLLVEDDAATRKALEAMLQTHQYHVLSAKNGNEALALLENVSHPVDLVISDIVMPQMGGLELYKQIQSRWPQVKTLFITGHPLEEQNQQLLQEGNIHWLQKPFTVREFTQIVMEVLDEELN
ncbi:MAG TPA: response regulator, partial [Anaerolineales bacterium]|nr:response regulator [Anaerolineales bacterium]